MSKREFIVSHQKDEGFLLHAQDRGIRRLVETPLFWFNRATLFKFDSTRWLNRLVFWSLQAKQITAIPITREQANELNPGMWDWVPGEATVPEKH